MQIKQTPFRKIRRAMSKTDFETWGGADVSNTLNTHDVSDVFSVNLVVEERCDEVYCVDQGGASRVV